MESKKCPYCNQVYPIFRRTEDNKGTFNDFRFNIDNHNIIGKAEFYAKYHLIITQCPNCGEDTLCIEERIPADYGSNKHVYQVKPDAIYNTYPDFVPQGIKDDYEEACAIKHLSPKASATLARRCLQGMIRDFWNISGKKSLNEEILAIQSKVPVTLWKAIDAVRQLGNIGAHPERDINLIVDVEDGEAEKIIKLIELLIDQWYINRYDQEQLFSDIVGINDEKQAERKKPT